MANEKTSLEAIVADLSAQVSALTAKLSSQTVEKSHEEVSEAETLRSFAPVDKLNAKLTYDLTLLNAFETIAQERRQREEMFALRLEKKQAAISFYEAKFQQELRHADIATENQWVDGGDPLDIDAIKGSK